MKGIELFLDIDHSITQQTEVHSVRIASKQCCRDRQEGVDLLVMMASLAYLASLQLQLRCLLVIVNGTLSDTNMFMPEPA